MNTTGQPINLQNQSIQKINLEQEKKMKPYLILHNQISLDGSIRNFEFNLEIHYKVAGKYEADSILVGSKTAKTGIEMFTEKIPSEEEFDFRKPPKKPDDKRAAWVIPDTRGTLINLLHVYRRSGYCRDIIILVSKSTPEEYIEHLKAREYDYIVAGEDRIDFRHALDVLSERYNSKTILTDSGEILNSVLMGEGLVDEISILISPSISGNSCVSLFKSLEKGRIQLELVKNEVFEKNFVWLVYKVLK